MSIYALTKDLINVEQKSRSFMNVGVHTNITLTEVVCETSKNGNPFLAFYFENEKGERASKTEWEVNANKPLETMNADEKAAYITKVNNQMGRIAAIAKCFISEEALLGINVADFTGFINRIKELLANKTQGIKLRIKIVYDYNDWATLPSYLKYPWIERMDLVPDDKTRMEIIDGIDKVVKSKPDDNKYESNPLATTTKVESKGADEDLPF